MWREDAFRGPEIPPDRLMTALLRLRSAGAEEVTVNATQIGPACLVTVVPSKPEEDVRVSCLGASSYQGGNSDGPWRPATIVDVVELGSKSSEYVELLSMSPGGSFRSTLLVVTVKADEGDDVQASCRPMTLGDSLMIKGWPFPQLLHGKFKSKYSAYVSCALPPMYLLDASLGIGGMEGASLTNDKGETVGFLGDSIQGVAGSRFLIGWDLSVIPAYRRMTMLVPQTPTQPDKHLSEGLSRLVSVHVGDTFGTGFIVCSHDNHVVVCTNAHVVGEKAGQTVRVRHPDGTVKQALRWVTFDGIIDLAFLRVPQANTLSLWPGEPLTHDFMGTPIVAIGFPGTWDPLSHQGPLSGPKLSRGRITSVLKDTQGACCFTTDAFITDGNSGSPIIRSHDGRLLGMVSSNAVVVSSDSRGSMVNRTYHPNLNFCLPAALILDTLRICIDEGPVQARRTLLARNIDGLLRWGEPARL